MNCAEVETDGREVVFECTISTSAALPHFSSRFCTHKYFPRIISYLQQCMRIFFLPGKVIQLGSNVYVNCLVLGSTYNLGERITFRINGGGAADHGASTSSSSLHIQWWRTCQLIASVLERRSSCDGGIDVTAVLIWRAVRKSRKGQSAGPRRRKNANVSCVEKRVVAACDFWFVLPVLLWDLHICYLAISGNGQKCQIVSFFLIFFFFFFISNHHCYLLLCLLGNFPRLILVFYKCRLLFEEGDSSVVRSFFLVFITDSELRWAFVLYYTIHFSLPILVSCPCLLVISRWNFPWYFYSY